MYKKTLFILILYFLISSDIFPQWVTVYQFPVNDLGSYPSVSVPNCSTVVVCGGNNNSPKVYLSTNAGLNFTDVTGNISTNELYCVYALNKDTIFTGDGGSPGGAGGNAKVYKTTNGGLNWSIMLSTGGNNGFISGITFSHTQPDFGIIVSDPALVNDSFWVARTNDRGKTWKITKAPNTAPYSTQNSLFAVDSMFYGFGLIIQPAKFYMTTNGGISWSVKTLGLNGNSVPSVSFKSDKLTGIAISDLAAPNIARTTNGGVNWQIINTGSTTTGVAIVKWIPKTSIFFLAASDIKRSSDNGLTWFSMNAPGGLNVSQMDIYKSGINSVCAYVISANGKLLKYEGEPFGINPGNTSVPAGYMLEQNYPNPFNPVTTINYSVPKPGNVKLTIYSLTGEELLTLVNGYHTRGNYTESADLSSYSSGLYIYELSSSDVSISRKMILIK